MNCPCKEVFIVTDEETARRELDRRYEQFPDCQDEIWDVYADTEPLLCEDCLILEEYERCLSK